MNDTSRNIAEDDFMRISRTMLAPEVVARLVNHGCPDITDELDSPSSNQYPIANGGFGDIYRARLRDGRQVAIKTMRMHIDSTNEGTKHLKRAARELHTWAKCDHPNVLELLGLAVFRDQIAMISPWMANASLPIYLTRNLNADRLFLCGQISNGLEYLHKSGIIHGDLKGLNIFVSAKGIPVLADFGNASLKDRTLLFTTTTANMGISHRWAAPELFQGPVSHTAESDMYGLGMTMLETITGSVPFREKNDFSVILAVAVNKELPERPKNTKLLNGKQGDALWKLLKNCWSYEPTERPDAAAVAATLRGLLDSRESVSAPEMQIVGSAASKFNQTRIQHIPGANTEVLVKKKNPTKSPHEQDEKQGYLNWLHNQPRRITVAAHGFSVVTCLLFSQNRIISASYDAEIQVHSSVTGEMLLRLPGHQGSVQALAIVQNLPLAPSFADVLVSGSADRTVRIWNLENGRCTHIFREHSSTIWCLAIVPPTWVDVDGSKQIWPKRTLIITGSQDNHLSTLKLPRSGEPEVVDTEKDRHPYYGRGLNGHTRAVRALAAYARTLVSGSDDKTVRVWDTVTGECRWILNGHSKEVYSVALDSDRNRAISGSMDNTVRIWSIDTGQTLHTLTEYSSLVALVAVSPKHIVSAAADSTLQIWDSVTGAPQHTLFARTGAVKCFQHDEYKVLGGSDGGLSVWDIEKGTLIRDLLVGVTVWQVVFEGSWCIAATSRAGQTYIDVWDFEDRSENSTAHRVGDEVHLKFDRPRKRAMSVASLEAATGYEAHFCSEASSIRTVTPGPGQTSFPLRDPLSAAHDWTALQLHEDKLAARRDSITRRLQEEATSRKRYRRGLMGNKDGTRELDHPGLRARARSLDS